MVIMKPTRMYKMHVIKNQSQNQSSKRLDEELYKVDLKLQLYSTCKSLLDEIKTINIYTSKMIRLMTNCLKAANEQKNEKN